MVLFRGVCWGQGKRECGSADAEGLRKGWGVSDSGSGGVGVHPAHSYALEYSPR